MQTEEKDFGFKELMQFAERLQAKCDAQVIASGRKPSRPPEYWACRLHLEPSIAVTEEGAKEYLSGCNVMKTVDLGWATLHSGIGVCNEHFVVTIANNGNATICSDVTARK